MANWNLLLRTDNKGLDQDFVIHNIYIEKLNDGRFEVHAFGGPDAQARYDEFVKTRKSILDRKGTPNATEERKETPDRSG